ncbi:MAG: hypothetical protein AMXMBFR53_03830 [Gemmatimonadota bacterium]
MVQELLAGPFGPILIFGLRVTDVSMATVRVLLIVRNAKWLVPIIGFFEVSLWVFAVSAVVQNLSSPFHLIGYAGGFATGNFVGMIIEERLALGLATMRTMVKQGGAELAAALREGGFAVTEQTGRGRDGEVEVLYSVISRRKVAPYIEVVERLAPDSFLVVDEPRLVRGGFMFPRRGR